MREMCSTSICVEEKRTEFGYDFQITSKNIEKKHKKIFAYGILKSYARNLFEEYIHRAYAIKKYTEFGYDFRIANKETGKKKHKKIFPYGIWKSYSRYVL